MASPAQSLRPLCWRSVLGAFRSSQPAMQPLAARIPTASFTSKTVKKNTYGLLASGHRKIKIHPAPPTAADNYKTPIQDLHKEQIAVLDPTGARTHLFSKENPEGIKVGDILLVRQKNGEPFAGVLINHRRRGVESGILLRNQLTRVGVEMWFKIYSPNVEGIEVVQRAAKRARRARLTYMRQPKHDIGSVEGVVYAYQRQMAALRGGFMGSGSQGSAKKSKKKGRK